MSKKNTMFSYPKIVSVDSLFNILGFEKVDSYTEKSDNLQRQFHVFRLKEQKINENELDAEINQIAISHNQLVEGISLSKDELKQMLLKLRSIKDQTVKRLIKDDLLGIYVSDIADFINSENTDIIEFIHQRLAEDTGILPNWDDELSLLEKLKEANHLITKCSKSANSKEVLSRYIEKKIMELKEINNDFANKKLKTFERIKMELE